jgi:hypothetical protein
MSLPSEQLVNYLLPHFFKFCQDNNIRFYMCAINMGTLHPTKPYKLMAFHSHEIDELDEYFVDREIINFTDVPIDQYMNLIHYLRDELIGYLSI